MIQDSLIHTWSHNQCIALCCALLLPENIYTCCWPQMAFIEGKSLLLEKLKLYWFSYRIMYIYTLVQHVLKCLLIVLGHTCIYYSAVSPIYCISLYKKKKVSKISTLYTLILYTACSRIYMRA